MRPPATLCAFVAAALAAGTPMTLRAAPAVTPDAATESSPGERPASKEPAAKEDTAKGDAPTGDAPADDASKGDAPADDAGKGDTSKGDAAAGDAGQGDAPADDAPADDAGKGDAPAGDATQGDAAKGDAASDGEPAASDGDAAAPESSAETTETENDAADEPLEPAKPATPMRTREAAPEFSTDLSKGGRLGFGIAGGVLTLGALALAGTSAYAMSRGAFYRDRTNAMIDDDPSTVTRDDLGDLEDRLEERASTIESGRRQNRIALATGIPAGILLGSGIALIILAARRPAKTQVSAAFGRRLTGLVLRTRF